MGGKVMVYLFAKGLVENVLARVKVGHKKCEFKCMSLKFLPC